ncbi:MAG: penicillin-binding protein 2 [Rhodobacteraceae bacterium]|nr:penicillin-binding protein 2 [Paracoccaceae bacterium]
MSLRNRDGGEGGAGKITRRGLILTAAQLGFMGLLAARLRYLQVTEAEEFRLLAEENRINIRLLPPARGLIFDRDGRPIAENQQNYRIVVVRENAGDVAAILDRLSRLIPLGPEDHAAALKELKRRSAFVPVTVAEHLTWEQVASVSANAPALPGVSAEVGLSRHYPRDRDFAHIVGYVGRVTENDLNREDDQDPLLQIPKFQIGKTGVELKAERLLRGFAGTRRIEVNALGRVMREIDRKEGKSGTDLHLTVDSALQNYLMARMDGQSASAVVMDVKEGDLLAIGSTPSFDPNKFVTGISVADYKALNDDPFIPLSSKSVLGTYPPGSTFKMMVALAALEDGVIAPDETVTCRGYHELGNQRFHCWKRGGHGRVNLKDSLKQSCDVYYYEVAQRVGIEKISAMAARFGLGERHDLPLNGIASGLLPTKEWKERVIGEPWRIGDSLNAGIGQGFVLASPLQLATMAARIASGRAVVPKLLRAVDGVQTIVAEAAPLGIASSSLAAVREGMFAVSNETGGTAYSTRIAEKSMRLAGKTGTSQVRRITESERRQGIVRNEDLPWERRDHALFVCYAPVDNPRYAVSVVIEHGGGGSAFAAPVARDIMLEALYAGPPPPEAYPASQRTRISNERKKLNLRSEGA